MSTTDFETVLSDLSKLSLEEKECQIVITKLGKSFHVSGQTGRAEKQTFSAIGELLKGKYHDNNCLFIMSNRLASHTVKLPLLRLKDEKMEEIKFLEQWSNYLIVALLNDKTFGRVAKVTCLE